MAKKPTPQELQTRTQRAGQLLQARNPQEALAILSPIMPFAQKIPAVLVTYARCLGAVGQHERCAETYRIASKLQPNSPDLRTEFAIALKRNGDYETSLLQIRRARESVKWHARAIFVEADLMMDMDRVEDAIVLLDEFEANMSGDSRTPQNLAHLCSIRSRLVPKHIKAEDIIDDLLRYAKDQEVPEGMRAMLAARAASVLDKLDRVDEAVESMAQSKALRRQPWDMDQYTQRIKSCIKAWSSEAAKALPVSTVDGTSMIFIVGMPRSGSSLLEQMLSRHPEIHPLGERNDITAAAGNIHPPMRGQLPVVSDFSRLTPELCQQVAERVAETVGSLRPRDKSCTVDKQLFNFPHVPLLARLLPGCKVIHTQRDPRDTCISYFMQWFNGSHGQANSFETLGRYFRDYMEIMEAWQALEPPSQRPEMLDVHYEQVVADPEAVMREVFGFLGLEFDSSVLDHTSSDRVVSTASRDQVKSGIYTSSVQRWKRFEKHLGPLKEHAGQYFND